MQDQAENQQQNESDGKEELSPAKVTETSNKSNFILKTENFKQIFKINIKFRVQIPIQLISIVFLLISYFNTLYQFQNSEEGDCLVSFIGIRVCQKNENKLLSWQTLIECDGKAENLCNLCALLPYFNGFMILLIFLSLLNRIWAENQEAIFDWTLIEQMIVLLFQFLIIILLKAFEIDEYSVGSICYAMEILSFIATIPSILLDIKLRQDLIKINQSK